MLATAFMVVWSLLTATEAMPTAVLVIGQAAAEMPMDGTSFVEAAGLASARLGGHRIVQKTVLKHSEACNVEALLSLNFDLELCGAVTPVLAERVLVFELRLWAGKSQVRIAYVGRGQKKPLRYLEHWVAGTETRAEAVVATLTELFSDYGSLSLTHVHQNRSLVFVDGAWLSNSAKTSELLVAPGEHVVELRQGGTRHEIAKFVVGRGEKVVLDVIQPVLATLNPPALRLDSDS